MNMKKAVISSLFVLWVLFTAGQVRADSALATIHSLEIEAVLQPDGSLEMREEIFFRVNGDLDRLSYIIDKEEGIDIEYSSFKIRRLDGEGEKKLLREDATAAAGSRDVYALEVGDKHHQKVDLFIDNQDQAEYRFELVYRMEGLGRAYDDSGRLFHCFISKELNYPVKDWTIDLRFEREGAGSLYYFGNREVEFDRLSSSRGEFKLSGDNILHREGVTLDLYFPGEVIPETRSFVPETARPHQEACEDAVAARRESSPARSFWSRASWGVMVVSGLLAFYVLRRAVKERQEGKSLTLSALSPLLIQFALDGVLSRRGLDATLLDFVRRGFIDLERDGEGFLFSPGPFPSNLSDPEADFFSYLQELSCSVGFRLSDLRPNSDQEVDRKRRLLKRMNSESARALKKEDLGSRFHRFRMPFFAGLTLTAVSWWMTGFFGPDSALIPGLLTSGFCLLIAAVSLSSTATRLAFLDRAEEERGKLLEGKGRGGLLQQLIYGLVLRIKREEMESWLSGDQDRAGHALAAYLIREAAGDLWFGDGLSADPEPDLSEKSGTDNEKLDRGDK